MAQFFKYFFAALLALFVFCLLLVFLVIGLAGAIASKDKVVLEPHSVLYLDLGKQIREQSRENPFAALTGEDEQENPGLYDVVQMLHYAKSDDLVDGIYLKCGSNSNGFATNEELRNALKDFRQSGKFVIAYGEVIPQKSYHVADVADKVYAHPKGGIDWKGFGIQYIFFKKALDKLEIQPQIFYAGKYKSATEPFREEQMTPANKLQSLVLLDDLYRHFIFGAAQARKLDSAKLRAMADNYAIRTAQDAVAGGLLDGVKYEDEVKEEIRRNTNSSSIDDIHFVSMSKYSEAVNYKGGKGTDRIALIYAQGDIVDGPGDENQIGGDRFRKYIRKARLDNKVKAIVIRINSGGGSAMASENMWREISLAKKDKPVVVSYGDVAASGGYYMACNADSIFALPTTITGSIGVFSIIPNLQGFFKDKLGVTFDGVETGPYANSPSIAEPLTDSERRFFQDGVDSIYQTFLTRVSDGRKMQVAMVDSIAQGRVWTGSRAITIGLVDRIGGLSDAMGAAAKLAKLKDYRVREYPEQISLIDKLTGAYKQTVGVQSLKKEMGEEAFQLYEDWQQVKTSVGKAQTKMPYRIIVK
ncbi:signal peptide peptidase SppA [Flavihumibacter profundi]|uniref:signal peptide peptidase SppA n=1 Tax=Flavihumibacter profundi TaxID=2716883 RepID=UPI001CC36C9C|nr:signal peptide peptidase SppA [Flavihumibacter profundi]MBZ5856496.1 signal peptide peptidase SppA [Flavihumibacter profundi]